MVSSRPFIFYSLPKSRTTQIFRRSKKLEIIWEDLKIFLESCTTASQKNPTSISLTVYEAYKDDKNPELATKIVKDAKSVFGKGTTQNIAVGYPKETSWEINSEILDKAVEYLVNGQPWPRFFFGPIELIITYWFKFIDPDNKTLLENQENESSLMIWLSRNSCCSADLYFPFSEPNDDFKKYINKIDTYLPFNIES